MNIVIFHSEHTPASVALVAKPEVATNPDVHIVNWFSDPVGRDAWLAEHPSVGPTILPTVWVWSPGYVRPVVKEVWLEEPRELGTYPEWESASCEIVPTSRTETIAAHWELSANPDESWEELELRARFYRERALQNPA